MKSEKREKVTLHQHNATEATRTHSEHTTSTHTLPFAFVLPVIWIMFISLTLLAPVQLAFFFPLLDSVDWQIRPSGRGVLLSARERRGRHPTPVPDQRGLSLLICFASCEFCELFLF